MYFFNKYESLINIIKKLSWWNYRFFYDILSTNKSRRIWDDVIGVVNSLGMDNRAMVRGSFPGVCKRIVPSTTQSETFSGSLSL